LNHRSCFFDLKIGLPFKQLEAVHSFVALPYPALAMVFCTYTQGNGWGLA